MLLAAGGVAYHAGKRTLAFRPRYQPDACKLFFTAATGWGSLEQRRQSATQHNRITVRHGRVELSQLTLERQDDAPTTTTVRLNNRDVETEITRTGMTVTLKFANKMTINNGDTLSVQTTANG